MKKGKADKGGLTSQLTIETKNYCELKSLPDFYLKKKYPSCITQFDKKKVIFCPHVLMVIFPFLGGKNDGK